MLKINVSFIDEVSAKIMSRVPGISGERWDEKEKLFRAAFLKSWKNFGMVEEA